MALYNVEFKVCGIDEDEYDEVVEHIQTLLEATEYRVEVGIGEETEDE